MERKLIRKRLNVFFANKKKSEKTEVKNKDKCNDRK